jgi:diguanylate cyclase (GGDEF)-like protein
MLGRLRASLMLRTLLAVLTAALAVGILALVLAGRVADRWERRRQREILEAQLDGVESVASAACFVQDRGLADQIVGRLVATGTIQTAILRTGSTELAKATRGGADPAHGLPVVSRRLQSPFIKQLQVGELVLTPDPRMAEKLASRTAFLLRVVVVGLTGSLVLTLAYTLHRTVVRPIALLSDRLHWLDAETGALLYSPPGHERDEIGRLVGDVNALLERLVSVIRQERELSERVDANLRDPLTGLPNRLGGEQVCAKRWAQGCAGLTLMRVNLDGFRHVNQNHGRRAGDAVLRQVALRLSALVGAPDLLARLGGDEFVLVLDGLTDETAAEHLVRKLIQAVGAPMALPGGAAIQVGASVGVVLHPGQEPSWPALLRRAAMAVEQAKRSGPNAARIYSS